MSGVTRRQQDTSASTKADLESLRSYIQEHRDFNEGWIALHLRDGHPRAAEVRKEEVAKSDRWLRALDAVIEGRDLMVELQKDGE